MTLYRKFGQALAILCCITMLAMAVVLVITGGISNQDEETKELIYFYERSDVQASFFITLAFLISVIANFVAADLPQIAAPISLLPLVMTFYEMAMENMNYVVASILLLLALIHTVSNFIAWWDMREWNRAHKVSEESSTAEEPIEK
jgi:hypothetical protein